MSTHQTLINVYLGNEDALRALRRIKPKNTVRYEGKSIKRRGFGEKIIDIPGVQGRAIPFPGSDVSIVRRSQALFHNNTSIVPVRYSMYALVQVNRREIILAIHLSIIFFNVVYFIFMILVKNFSVVINPLVCLQFAQSGDRWNNAKTSFKVFFWSAYFT